MHRNLPSGVVTLLFTDIEGSTRLLQRVGDGYADVLAKHRRVLREAFARHGGVEVDTQGDAFLVAFDRASDAVAAAADAQRALAATEVRVRMGVHTGEPRTGTEGYVGLDLHRGARIAASAHGGQVVLSESTRALVDAPVRDLGGHRLKDLTEPEHLYQLEIDGLANDFPMLRTLDAGRSNLPLATTSFVGRDSELALVDEHLDDPACRLLTLVGPGGAGKSRLSVEAARRRTGRYAHGVFQVALAPVAEPSDIVSAIAGALGLTIDTMFGPERSSEEQLQRYLADRSVLLLLDNFEHLLAGAEMVGRLLEAAPHADVLVTSRERLALQAEWVVEVPGLGPAAEKLFEERARRVDARFRLDATNFPHVERVCRAVERMPLGIELAAASMAMLSPSELAAEIERDLDVLTASARDVPERHRSLRAAFEASWRLLDADQRAAFRRLAAFRGAFTREAALAVTQAPLPVLSALVDKSLVRRTEVGRFDLHELLRQYAAEALIQDVDDLSATRLRHARHYAGLLRSRASDLAGAEMLRARDELRLDVANVVGAVEWFTASASPDDARLVLRDLDAFYMAHSWAEGADAFARLAQISRNGAVDALPDRDSPVFLRAQSITAFRLAMVNAAERSDAAANEVLPAARDGGDPWDLGMCLLALGINAVNRGDDADALRWLGEARDVAFHANEQFLLCWVDLWLGWADLSRDDVPATREHFEEALAAAQATASETNVAFAFSKLGMLADHERRFREGLRFHLDAYRCFGRVGDPLGVGYSMSRASLSAYALGEFEASADYARTGLDGFAEVNHAWGVVSAQVRLGLALIQLGEVARARELLLDALATSKAMGFALFAAHALTGLAGVIAREGDAARAGAILRSIIATEMSAPAAYLKHIAADELAAIDRVEGGAHGDAPSETLDLATLADVLLREQRGSGSAEVAVV